MSSSSSNSSEVLAAILNGCGRYDVAHLEKLESHVSEQITNNTCNTDCNMAILKLYLMYPSCCKVEVLRNILIKALMRLPDSEFNQCLLQIPRRVMQVPQLQALANLEEVLQCCHFKQCWTMLRVQEHLVGVSSIPGFTDALRRYMTEILALSCLAIPATDLASLLNLNVGTPEFERLLRNHSWTLEEVKRATGASPATYLVRIVPKDGAKGQSQSQSAARVQQQTNVAAVEKVTSNESLRSYLSTLNRSLVQ